MAGLQRGSIPQSYTVQRRVAEGVEHHPVANGVEPAVGLAENVRAAYNLSLEHQRSTTGNAVELHVLVGFSPKAGICANPDNAP